MTYHCHPCTMTAVHSLALGCGQHPWYSDVHTPVTALRITNMAGTGMWQTGLVLICGTKPTSSPIFSAMKQGCAHPWYTAVKCSCGTAIFVTMLHQRIFSHSWHSLCSSSALVQLCAHPCTSPRTGTGMREFPCVCLYLS